MTFTNREEQLKQEIEAWENRLDQLAPTSIESTYEEWVNKAISLIPPHVLERYLEKINESMFYLTALVQGTEMQMQAAKRIIETARVFDENISEISQLKQLQVSQLSYICEHQLAKQRLYSLSQGALSGTGQPLLLGVDLPALLFINLQAIQQAAMSYGYDVHAPSELMLTLKVFHGAILPKHLQRAGWEQMKQELNQSFDPYFYEGPEHIIDETCIHKMLVEIAKAILILITKRRLYNHLPLVSMVVGSGMNYRFTRQVTEYAKRFYQYRYLSEKCELIKE
ncbi:EcsC family protein [Priestia megaterium]|nr:EcsC family protein [Priestia megaterium]